MKASMIASFSARLIAEEWMVGSCSPRLDGAGIDLGWFDRLAETRPVIHARLVPKVSRMIEAAQVADPVERQTYARAFEIMRETVDRL
jgi:hypothetical protein